MRHYRLAALVAGLLACGCARVQAQGATVTIDTSAGGRRQVIDGFGTCIGNDLGKDPAFQQLYFDDLGCSIVRMDLTPRFVTPYSSDQYDSPWFYGNGQTLTFPPGVPADEAHRGGPDKNNVRTYTSAEDYTREFGGRRAQIAVMGPNIEANIRKLVVDENGALAMAKAGVARRGRLGDFKLYGSIWSPAPWVKVSSGNKIGEAGAIMPKAGTPWPFIWGGNFAGGRVDVSGKPLAVFNDGAGPTSALQQFARSTAAYVKGLQDRNGVHFYGISIQNEVNFEEFYNSATYPLSSQYITALKAIRAEFDKYPDLKDIRIVGPEDLLGGDVWGMWQLGGGDRVTHKNLQYLKHIGDDPAALSALGLFCVHGYAADGATAVGADPKQWTWWAKGWQQSPTPGIPSDVKGFTAYGKRSWMTETSGEQDAWLSPATGFPRNGAFSIALKIHQALTTGMESAWIYWQFAEADRTTPSCLTGKTQRENAPKYVAAKHFFKFIRPNSVRVEATVAGPRGLEASAYVNEADRALTVVLLNTSTEATTVRVAVPARPAGLARFQTYTSDSAQLWRGANVTPQGGALTVTVPAYGVVTLYGRAG